MKRIKILIFLITAAMLAACTARGIIPKKRMADIYYDMYMADFLVSSAMDFSRMADTSAVYEAVFQKYGYTSEDFRRSNDYYLSHLSDYKDIFESVKAKCEKRIYEINRDKAKEVLKNSRNGVDSLELTEPAESFLE